MTANSIGMLSTLDDFVESLVREVHHTSGGLRSIPTNVILVIRDGAWRERYSKRYKRIIGFDSFAEFVTADAFAGLGATPDLLRALCKDDPEALAMLEGALKGEHGGDHGNQYSGGKANNISLATRGDEKKKRKHGTGRAYLVERLSRERPDLFQLVADKKLSAHQAAIEAGWVKPTVTIPADDPSKAARALVRNFSPKDIARIIAYLCAETDRWPDEGQNEEAD